MVTMPAFHPFRFISMEALSVATEKDLLNWHDGGYEISDDAIQTALRHLQKILLETNKSA